MLAVVAPAAAQTVTATTDAINGIVTDNTGAVVPRATVSLSGPSLLAIQATTTDAAGGYGQASAQLAGSVEDATGLPLAGVTLTLRGASNRITQTDSEGQFEFQTLPEGEYELTATLAGFAPARQIARLVAAQRSVIALTLTVLILEQTVVTAARTGEADVQTVPMAVSVLPGIQLARMQDHTVEHIAGRAPGVTFSQNTGRAQVTIRGIGTNAVAPGSDPSSALYLDGVYLARPAMVLADFLDLDRVEVLRGPQGTLYGRNSLGGAINLITKAPTNDREASIRVSGGSDGTFRVDGRVSGPIIPGRLMGSGAILRGVRTGTVRDLNHPDRPLGGEDVIGARGQLRVVLNRRTELRIAADLTDSDPAPLYYSKILAVKPGFQVDNPAGFHDVRASFPAEGRTFQGGASARLTVDLTPSIRATSLTAFRGVDFETLTDTDISELDLSVSRAHEIQHQFSEEVTVASRDARLIWIAGLFLFGETDRQPTSIYAPASQLESRFDPRVDADASAAFGQATFVLTPRVAVTAGLRYTHERKTIDNAFGRYPIDSPTTRLSGSSYSYTDAISHDAWTPKFGLEMRASEDLMAYASATRGFKSGGFNITSPEAGRGFAPEWAWSYEGGLKTVVGGGRARLNVAAFQTNYSDLQVQTAIRPGVLDISNAAAATIRGVELEATTLVRDRVHAGGHVAWLDATYDQYLATGVGGVTSDVAGRRLNNSPEWSGRVWIDGICTIGRASSLSLRADSTWKTTVFFTPFNDSLQRQRPIGLLDISAEFRPTRRRWSVAAYARNLTNEDYITGSSGSPPPAFGGRPGDVRQLGVQWRIGL